MPAGACQSRWRGQHQLGVPHHTGNVCSTHLFQAHGTRTHLLVELHGALCSLLSGLLLVHPDLRALEAWQYTHRNKSPQRRHKFRNIQKFRHVKRAAKPCSQSGGRQCVGGGSSFHPTHPFFLFARSYSGGNCQRTSPYHQRPPAFAKFLPKSIMQKFVLASCLLLAAVLPSATAQVRTNPWV
jgi:hypothetical protein